MLYQGSHWLAQKIQVAETNFCVGAQILCKFWNQIISLVQGKEIIALHAQ